MRKVNEIKYPNSARLFAFCKSVLDVKFGAVRIIDQDVGQILGFDPADCSHWKKGRKQIRSVDSMKTIATHLGVDERLVMDVASGAVTDTEAFIEYKGLGLMDVAPSLPESVRRDWQRRSGLAWTTELEGKLKSFFSINDEGLDAVITEIHERLNFKEAPLFLPELTNAYPGLRFVMIPQDKQVAANAVDIAPKGKRLADGTFEVTMGEQVQTRPVSRFQAVRVMAPFFVSQLLEPAHIAFKDHESQMRDIYSNVFAARMLVPAKLVRQEMSKVDLGRDIVGQLAETFWVSRALMNRRLRDILSGSQF